MSVSPAASQADRAAPEAQQDAAGGMPVPESSASSVASPSPPSAAAAVPPMELEWSTPEIDLTDVSAPSFETIHYHSALFWSNSKIFIYGGKESEGCVKKLRVLDVGERRLLLPDQENTDCLLPVSGHTAWVHNDRMYIFGGEQRDLEGYVNELWRCDCRTFKWEKLKVGGTWEIPSPREGHAAVYVGNETMMLFGGANEKKYFNTQFFLDMKTLVWSRLHPRGLKKEFVPSPRFYHTMEVYSGIVYLFGGWIATRADKRVDPSRLVYRFDLSLRKWIEPLECPSGLFPHGQASCKWTVVGGTWLVLFGGYRVHTADDEHRLSAFNMKTHAWKWGKDFSFKGGEAYKKLHHPTLTAVGDQIFLIGGNMSTESVNHNIFCLKDFDLM